jgi:DNA-binding transcriptional MerR regulator
LYTVDTTLESLRKYDITETDLLDWEKSLGLDISVDAYGRKQYSPHHINLFKNVKKHLALGRTLNEIRQIIVLPPLLQSRPQAKTNNEQAADSPMNLAPSEIPAASSISNRETSAFDPISALAASSSASVTSAQKVQDFITELDNASSLPLPESPTISEFENNSLPSMDKSPYASTPKTPTVHQPVASNSVASSNINPTSDQTVNATPLQNKIPNQTTSATQTSIPTPNPIPIHPSIQAPSNKGASEVVHLVQRLTQEKDQLYKKLLETEKLNSHLYSANSLFHKKTNEMSRQINQLRENLNENERFKLLDDKARLHKQLLDAERNTQSKQEEIQARTQENSALKDEIQHYKQRIQMLSAAFNPDKFRGDWMEAGRLVDVLYDNFGINIESERVRLFRISDTPNRRYGRLAIIHTNYQYETNNLWRRDETLAVAYSDEDTLEGELTAEYILDGVPVAKALYRITCRRHR